MANLKLQKYLPPSYFWQLSIKDSCAFLLTEAISFFPPIKTVSLPIFASNFPCLESKSSRSFGVASAISTSIKLFPDKSETGSTFKSDNPNSLRRLLVTSAKSFISKKESFLSRA